MANGSDIPEPFRQYKDGKPISVKVGASYLNAHSRFIGFIRDSSVRNHSQERLRQNGKQLGSLVEQAPISIAMLDRELRYLATSARWVREFGRGNKDLIGLSHYEVHPDISNEWKRVHREALAGAHLTHDADLWVQEDGSRHWLRWAVYPWIDDNGDIGGLVIYAEDITALKLAEEQMLEKVLEALPVGVWLVNRDGDILLGNPAGRSIWQGANFAGAQPYGDFKAWRHETGEFVTPDQWALTRAIRNGESVAEETLDIECFDGSRKTIINAAMPLHSTDGQIIGAIAVNQDITEKLRMADALPDRSAAHA
jgi:PAS domain S-box-containing protein